MKKPRKQPSTKKGIRKRQRKAGSLNVVMMIDDAFAKKVQVTEGGVTQSRTVFEAILLQIWLKAAKKQKKALRGWMRYQKFANKRGGIGGVELQFEPKPKDWDEQKKRFHDERKA